MSSASTVITKYITQTSSGVTEDELTQKLTDLQNRLTSLIASGNTGTVGQGQYSTGGYINNIALTNKIDQLSGTALSNIIVNGVSGLTDADIPDTITASNYVPITGGLSLINFLRSDTGAVARTVNDKLSDELNVKDFGAVGDGTTDDSSAIQKAINATCSMHGGKVVFGAKIYAIGSGLTIPCSNVLLVGQGAGGSAPSSLTSTYTDSNYLGATVIKWIGASGGTMVTFEPVNGAATGLKGGGIDDMVLAGYGIAGTGLKLRSVNGASFPRLTIENTTSVGLDMNITSNSIGSIYDTQQNHFGQLFVIFSATLPAVYNAIGVLMDGGQSANTSMNTFDYVYLKFEAGVGMKLANADSNTIGTLLSYQPIGYTAPLLTFEASTSANGAARDNTFSYVQNAWGTGGVVAYGNGGSGSSSHNQILSFDNANGGSATPVIQPGASLVYATTRGSMGTTTVNGGLGLNMIPNYALDVAGFVNTDQYSGFKQAGNTVLYASTTNYSLAIDASNAAAWMSATSTLLGNLAVGFRALAAAPTSAGTVSQNTAIGAYALNGNNAAGNNTAVGYQALFSNDTGSSNTAVGQGSLSANRNGTSNIALGVAALQGNTSGSGNVAIGTYTLLANTTGSNNTADGYRVLRFNVSATSTTALGYQAGTGVSNYNNQGGVYIGYQAGLSASTNSDYNTFVGYQAGYSVTSGGYNIAIGQNVDIPLPTGSQQLNIGNLLYGTGIYNGSSVSSVAVAGKIGIATSSPWRTLSVTGTVGLDGLGAITGVNSSLCLSANKEVVYSSNSDSCSSSLRSTKHSITNLDVDAIADVVALNPVSFIYNNDASSTVHYGFIAEDTAAVDTHMATYDANGNISGIDDRSILSVAVKALQALIAEVNGFAQNFATQTLVANVGTFQELCVGSTCVNEAEFKALLEKENVSSESAPSAPAPVVENDDVSTSTASSNPPTDSAQATTIESVPDAEETEAASSTPAAEVVVEPATTTDATSTTP